MWDVLGELQAETTDTRRQYEESHPADFANLTIPDRFPSFSTYLAVWLPLLKREVRAQTLNGLITDPPTGSPAKVRLGHAAGGHGTAGALVTMDAELTAGAGGGSDQLYGSGELVLIMREADALKVALGQTTSEEKAISKSSISSIKDPRLKVRFVSLNMTCSICRMFALVASPFIGCNCVLARDMKSVRPVRL